MLFGSKIAFLWQEGHYYMVYIADYTELNLQVCSYAQKRRICREHAPDDNLYGHFALAEGLPTSATLLSWMVLIAQSAFWYTFQSKSSKYTFFLVRRAAWLTSMMDFYSNLQQFGQILATSILARSLGWVLITPSIIHTNIFKSSSPPLQSSSSTSHIHDRRFTTKHTSCGTPLPTLPLHFLFALTPLSSLVTSGWCWVWGERL